MNLGRLATRFLLLGGATGVGGGTYLSYNNVDWSSIGVVRFGRAFKAASCIVVDYKWSLYGKDSSSEDYKSLLSQIHLRSAHRLLDLACKNGGVFIKLGQHIGALDYLLPPEYVQTMKVLHDRAPESSLQEIKKVMQEDLQCNIEDVFSSFSEKPLGTASLAQVHEACLQDGTKVAIKVQHPKVKEYSEVDMNTVDFLLHLVVKVFPDFEFLWLSDEMRINLPLELDFVHEGKNAEKVRHLLEHFKFLRVPKVHWQYTTKRVLTMDFHEGGRVDDRKFMLDNRININKVTENLGKMYSEMIFVHGYVHCDPHPGNVLVNKTSNGQDEIVLLDHGLYQSLTDSFRFNYSKLWQCILGTDIEGIRKYSEILGAGRLYGLFACMVTARSWESVTAGIDKKQKSEAEKEEIQEFAANYIPEISQLLNQIPREMLLILKTNDLLRSIEFALHSRHTTGDTLVSLKLFFRENPEKLPGLKVDKHCVYTLHFSMNAHSTRQSITLLSSELTYYSPLKDDILANN